jgi:hypothetical protein
LTWLKEKPASEPTETDFAKDDVESLAHSSTSKKNNYGLIIPQTQKKASENCKDYATNLFSQIKDSLDITVVLDYYGLSVNSTGFANCPFHQENTPSFKVYTESNSYYCFGCGEHGTVIDFVMRYFHLTTIGAVTKLNDDFKLNLMLGRSARTANCRPPLEDKNIINSFADWEKRAFVTLSSYFRALRFWGEQVFIHHGDYFNKYINDVENIVFVENLLDIMIANTYDFPAQVEFYKTFGGEVNDIECRQHFLND